jgi:hypothetical protein
MYNGLIKRERGIGMNTVIKGTKTIEEYKQLKAYMEQRAKEHYEVHRQAFENWKEGGIDKVWMIDNDNIRIQYESGEWWCYNEKGEWWK